MLASTKLLNFSSKSFFYSLVLSQVLFVIYLAVVYGLSTLTGNLENWNNSIEGAFVSGDGTGNSMFGIHVLFSIVMFIGGPLQFVPKVRTSFPLFHRINGRAFVTLACLIALSGLYMIHFRKDKPDAISDLLISFNGLSVLVCACFTVSFAMKRKIALHQVWAMRLFLVCCGVLFFRLCIFAWFIIFGPLGIDVESFTGPTVTGAGVVSYLLPLVLFELYRRAKSNSSGFLNYPVSLMLLFASLCFAVGTFGITMGFWLPRMI